MGILEMVYEFLCGYFGSLEQETNLSSADLEMLNAVGYYASIITAVVVVLFYVAVYILLTVTFIKGYKNKGYKNLWLCYIPIVHICCFVQLIEAEKVWNMSKGLLCGLLMGIIGVNLLLVALKDLTFFNDIFTYWGGGNISLDQIYENYSSVDKQGLLYSYYNIMIWLTNIAGFVFFYIAVLVQYFKTRTNKTILCMIGSILLPEIAFAIMALVLVNKKAQPKVVYTTYYPGGQYGQNPFGNINPNAQSTQQEPFSEFGETKQEEPFSEFNETQETKADYEEQPEVETEKPQENTEQKVVENTTNAEPQQEQVDTTEDNDEDDLF